MKSIKRILRKQTGPSPPSRGRGLKYMLPLHHPAICGVAPLAGAWIEIY